jgi:hypothetical protein
MILGGPAIFKEDPKLSVLPSRGVWHYRDEPLQKIPARKKYPRPRRGKAARAIKVSEV